MNGLRQRLTSGWKSGYGEVVTLAWPAIGEMFLYTVVWIVDTAMVGRLGPEQVAAVGWGGQVLWVASAIFMGFSVATTSLVARAVGAGSPRRARLFSSLSLVLALGSGIVVAAAFWFAAPFLFTITGMPPAVSVPGSSYLRIVALGNLVAIPLWAASAAHRGYGNTRTPLVGSIIVNVVNIFLDYVLIFGQLGFPELGVTGAAVANVAGTLCSSAYVIGSLYLYRLRGKGHATPRPSFADVKELVLLGIPSGLENTAIDGARAVAGFLIATMGTLSFAANQLATTAESLSFMPGFGFAVASSVVAGQYVGAGRPELARVRVSQALRLGLLFMGFLGLLFMLVPHAFVRLFTTDVALQDLAAATLRVAGLSQVFVGTTEIFAGALRGAGDTQRPLLVTVLGAWGVRLPLTYLLVVVLHLPLPFVWLAMVADWGLRSLLMGRVYSRSERFASKSLEVGTSPE